MWAEHDGCMRTTRISFSLLAAAATLATLSACTGSPGGASTQPRASTASAEPATSASTQPATAASASPTDTETGTARTSTSCGPYNATTAVQKAVIALPAPIPAVPSAHWDAPHAEDSGYDACAALSWAVVSVEGGTPSSPNAILLFHDGTFLGTATKVQYPFDPTVTRTAADAIHVTYRYAKPSDANANPSGTTNATFTWDTASSKVEMTGSVPPQQ
jgi:hypothetical protein